MDDDTFGALLVLLSASERNVERKVHQVREEGWDEVIHTGDGAWTRRQLLCHMAANDLRQLVRIRVGAGIEEPGDEAAHAAERETHDWNQARVQERQGLDVQQILAEMRTNREALVALLRSLTEDQRDRPIPFRGQPTPLGEVVPALIAHLEEHANELMA